MFSRILIANRGEIAVRVIRACREMGRYQRSDRGPVESIAVYSDADAHALHVTLADHAVRIGPAPAAESYLSIDAILAAARQTGADAIHPGYGFLSENADFAAACADAGIAFIGPPADAIRRMGSKIAARAIAQRAGVPIVPGDTPRDQSDAAIAAAASRIGFPVLLKPSAGGGGIGMKAVRDESTLLALIAQARREAAAAFGDGTLYVEKLVERPRHVEFQILADHHGNVVHVFERECSIQRRHQKVIEETPSVAVTPSLRARMGAAAIAVARAADYRNAGTIEFLLEGTGDEARFYFLEMNTRLQVEHPITEQVAGIDLVQAQIAIAAGAPLPWTQETLTQRGHAFEMRIYAEHPLTDLPQAGPLLLYRQPTGPGIRVDSGVIEGSEVSVHYDPLIAKLIATGETRDIARRRAHAALAEFAILGIRTNIRLLAALLEHDRVIAGEIDTGFLDALRAEAGDAFRRAMDPEPSAAALAVAAAANAEAGRLTPAGHANGRTIGDPWSTLRGVRV
jgi:3-methylcrotonyl-CoA carboxylase alpha subunit